MSTEAGSIELARNVQLKGNVQGEPSDRELHASDGANLPALCLDCGAPVRRAPEKRVYRGFKPGAWWLFLLKAGTRAVVIRLFGRKITVGTFLCEEHRSSRKTKSMVGLAGMLLALPLLVALSLSGMSGGLAAGIFIVWSLAAVYIRSTGTEHLSVKGVTEQMVGVFESPNNEFVRAAASAAGQVGAGAAVR